MGKIKKLSSRLLISATFVTVGLFSVANAAPAVVPKAPDVAAKGYLLMDYHSGAVLVESNADEILAPASLTKMMTSYIIGREIASGNISPDDKVLISENAWAKNFPDSSKMFIEVNTYVKVSDLNRGIIIQSGNDACVAMSEHIAGSEDAFAGLMNSYAEQLGMGSSHFMNSHGLHHEDHYTTARDMATLAQALIRDVPEEYAIYAEKEFTYNGIKQYNRNSLLWDKSMNVDGIKTGHTSKAGYSLVTSGTKDGMRLISVVMGTNSEQARKAESKKLLNYGFRFFETVTAKKAGDAIVNQRIWYGSQENVELGVLDDVVVTIPRGQADKLSADFGLERPLEAPLSKGEQVGSIQFSLDGKVVAEYPLVALQDIEEGGWFSKLVDYLTQLVMSWFE
ncbi:D-alanyl-D-alanine carboxypeptidase [Corallincola holothuriorum]|uniref:serine-type D-Ala-D-Ala carboxypeptidase n=1 Tax=Corallincola holothuriorum TaxID=2282215 RepID=A0A368NHE7_9GAMM|nr:D-alanyl-D-alanine carboxypeptidase [Corallincola holothuriorum]